jgi:hypothetical protein
MDDPIDKNEPQGEHRIISLASHAITSSCSVASPTVWLSYSFAPEWLADARREAETGSDHHSRRREIIFSVSVAETYLVEWVRDEVLNRDFSELSKFFPPGDKAGVLEKWKRVRKTAGLRPVNGSYWEDFCELVAMRNGLIHASSSRPETDGQPEDEQPKPSRKTLEKLQPGWAVGVVLTVVKELHDAAGTSVPKWIDG